MTDYSRYRRAAGLFGLLAVTAAAIAAKGATAGHGAAVVALSAPPKSVSPATSSPPATSSTPAVSTPPSTSSAASIAPAPSTPAARVTNPTSAPPTESPTTRRTAPPPTAAPTSRTLNGDAESFRYGTIQVRVTIRAGKITDVATLQEPTDGRSGEIAGFAIPQLRSEVLAAQSPQIDVVSGASYDSQAYALSVQSALDRAGG